MCTEHLLERIATDCHPCPDQIQCQSRTFSKEPILSNILNNILKHAVRLPAGGTIIHALLQLSETALYNDRVAVRRPRLLDGGRQQMLLVVIVDGLLGALARGASPGVLRRRCVV